MPTITEHKTHNCDAEIADQLLGLIRPHYKGLRGPGERPEFKRSMKGQEVEDLLLSLHNIVVNIKHGGHISHGR